MTPRPRNRLPSIRFVRDRLPIPLLVLGAALLAAPLQNALAANIDGFVYDKLSRATVPGATLTFSRAGETLSTHTGPGGYYHIFNVTPGVSYTLTISAPAYETKTNPSFTPLVGYSQVDPVLVPLAQTPVVARGDTYATPVGKTLDITASSVSGVLYNDFYTDPDGKQVFNSGLTAIQLSDPSNGTLSFAPDGSFTYTPDAALSDNGNDSFTYQVQDANGNLSNVATVNIHVLSDQPDFKIMMNYELGMHCTGFEFSYCCILPPYNSIVAQVVKPQAPGDLTSNADYPRILRANADDSLDGLGRETVLRDYDSAGNFNKYVLEYFHDAMPRREGNMPVDYERPSQTSTLISAAEGNSLLYYSTPFDSAAPDPTTGKLIRDWMDGIPNVVQGNGRFDDPTDNFANGWLNHLYIYKNAEGNPNLEGENASGGSLEIDKIRLGVTGMVEYPKDCGPALQPLGPNTKVDALDLSNPATTENTCGGASNGNVLTFSGDTGTIVYTQSNVLENLPITLTSPGIWEALGLPLTPFEDTISFFADPGAVDEDTIRPFVAMKAQLRHYDPSMPGGKGDVVMGSNGKPVIGFGAAPIDIPNCERCHGAQSIDPETGLANINSPNWVRRQNGPDPFYGWGFESLEELSNLEIEYWKAIYPTLKTKSDWYARLKGAAVNMISMHDYDIGTNFSINFPTSGLDANGNPEPLVDLLGQPAEQASIPQNTRFGHQSVICQRCHGDNVIAAVTSAVPGIRPISEAIHDSHMNTSAGGPIMFSDSLGRFGGCQGCHPAHRSDGVMDKYPITKGGDNANADGDNRLGKGGCFVGRDVHSNPLKDLELHGGNTPVNGKDIHLNAVGQWLSQNVSRNQEGRGGSTDAVRGIWCTNCHTQLSQEIWRAEDCNDLIHGDCEVNPRAAPDLNTLASMVGLSTQQLYNYIDPKNPQLQDPDIQPPVTADETHAAWNPSIPDANVATIEVTQSGTPVGTTDADGDFSVNILSFCTTQDCVNLINANKTTDPESAAFQNWRYPVSAFQSTANKAAAVPFDAATAGRDHWLAAGEPHCADCHAAPYTEQSGNINFFPPFNYPAKAGLMRYSFGHQGISCQGCHESIHGLYPVGAAIDNTTYAQAAALNADGSHGPLKCGTCHQTYIDANGNGVPTWINGQGAWGNQYVSDFEAAVGFAHEYTAEANVLDTTCQNCHGDFKADITAGNEAYLTHAYATADSPTARSSRLMMDGAETAQLGHVLGAATNSNGSPNLDVDDERVALCSTCHSGDTNRLGSQTCDGDAGIAWKQHLSQGMVAEVVWEDLSQSLTPALCGW